jgi:hypothetical protein
MVDYTVKQVGEDEWLIVDAATGRPAKDGSGTDIQPQSYDEACSLASVLEIQQAELMVKFGGATAIRT